MNIFQATFSLQDKAEVLPNQNVTIALYIDLSLQNVKKKELRKQMYFRFCSEIFVHVLSHMIKNTGQHF